MKRGDWTFRVSVADAERMMIMAFGPDSKFEMRFFYDPEKAKEYIENRVIADEES